ncbi:MAG: pyrroline-5-carboxylate reductase [Pseudomonadota bacterium]|jgi:pyrroline-5-carboxylate reductase
MTTVCFIGGGNMAVALIGGMLKRGYSSGKIHVVEINPDACAKLHNEFSVQTTSDMATGVAGCEAVLLAVKPQQLRAVAQQLAPLLQGQLIISIAAGIRAGDLARWLGTRNVVRAMPNTPALIRCGMTGLYALPEVEHVQRERAQSILKSVGEVMWLEEEGMMDAVTAVSGSGPAYVFYFIEALQAAGESLGFSADEAQRLALNTFVGAAKLAHGSEEPPAVLRARVTSKNGTTERALLSLEAQQVSRHIVNAAHAAALRAKEMGDELGRD